MFRCVTRWYIDWCRAFTLVRSFAHSTLHFRLAATNPAPHPAQHTHTGSVGADLGHTAKSWCVAFFILFLGTTFSAASPLLLLRLRLPTIRRACSCLRKHHGHLHNTRCTWQWGAGRLSRPHLTKARCLFLLLTPTATKGPEDFAMCAWLHALRRRSPSRFVFPAFSFFVFRFQFFHASAF